MYPPRQVWEGPPEDVLPGVVPVELILGRSDSTVVMLTGIRAFPSGVQMNLAVRVHPAAGQHDLLNEMFGDSDEYDRDTARLPRGLTWGFELSDGARVTNRDRRPKPPDPDVKQPEHLRDWLRWTPEQSVLTGGGGGGHRRSVDQDYWLWPLPTAGRLRVLCQWLGADIEFTVQDLDCGLILDAAGRAQPVWPAD